MNTIPYKIKTFGHSMSPLLLDGDLVFLKKIRFQNIKTNAIICVRKNGKVFTHRVIYKTSTYLITKGDNNYLADDKIYPKNVVGLIYKVKRNGRIFNPEDIYLLQSTLYFQEIVKIKNALEKVGINFVFLKGLPLYIFFEKQYPKRIYWDCDILVSKNDFLKAEEILRNFGYQKSETHLSELLKRLQDKESEVSFYRILNGFLVVFDIHLEVVFMMTQLGKLDPLYPQILINKMTDEFLKDKRTIEIQNEDFPILSAENLFIYLCLHLFHHNLKEAFRYEFLKTLIHTDKIDYAQIALGVNKYKLNNFVYSCLLLIKKHYGVRFQNQFLKQTQPKRRVLNFIKNKILKEDIFNEQDRIGAGIRRFKNLFYLSPNPLYKRLLVFLSYQVFYAVFWSISRRFQRVFLFFTSRSIQQSFF